MGKHKFPNDIDDPALRETAYLVEAVGDFLELLATKVVPPTLPFHDDDLNEAFVHICQHYASMMAEVEGSYMKLLAKTARERLMKDERGVTNEALEDAIKFVLNNSPRKRG